MNIMTIEGLQDKFEKALLHIRLLEDTIGRMRNIEESHQKEINILIARISYLEKEVSRLRRRFCYYE